MVFATAVRLLGNPADAEDVAQTVFLRAFQRFDEIGSSPAAAGWLKAVARNACLNHLSRYRARWRLFSEIGRPETEDSEAGYEAGLTSEDSLALDVEQADLLVHLEQALRRLPDHQRIPIVLFHFEDMGYQEIAGVLGVSLAKVKTDIHRGRRLQSSCGTMSAAGIGSGVVSTRGLPRPAGCVRSRRDSGRAGGAAAAADQETARSSSCCSCITSDSGRGRARRSAGLSVSCGSSA
jgi:RNA polymerase sigma-70 factor (ECF subfamily)